MKTEEIKFQVYLNASFWDKPPIAKIFVDDICKWDSNLVNGTNLIEFTHSLDFTNHCLRIERTNKTDDQHRSDTQTQVLTLEKLTVDGINIRNIVWRYSWFEPEYPKLWALLQKKQGNVLEEKILAGTTWGHNGTWYLNFSSPVYKYIINWMNGELNEPF